MKIRRMDATFGKLSRSSLELKDGLNIVQGSNESGKSTWCGFIRAMLYGISTREQSKTGFLADKERFRPWSGENMHGKMQVEYDGRDLIIERTSGRTGVMGSAIVTDMHTGLTVNEFTEPGESMLAIKKEVFERSAFIGQALLKVENDKSGELERRIVSMAGSGEEDVSYSVVEKRLKGWKNRRRYNSRGEAPELEAKIESLRVKLNSLRGDARALTAKRMEIERLLEMQSTYRKQAEVWKSLRAWEKINLNRDAEKELENAQQEYDRAVQEAKFGDVLPTREILENLQKSYQQYVNSEKNYTISIENVRKAEEDLSVLRDKLSEFESLNAAEKVDAQADKAQVEELRAQAEKVRGKKPALVGVVCGILAAALLAGAGYALWLYMGLMLPVCMIPAALALVLGVVIGACKGAANNKKGVELESRAMEILKKYNVADAAEILGRASQWARARQDVEGATENVYAAQNCVDRDEISRKENLEKLNEQIKLLDVQASEQDAAEIIDSVRTRLENISRAKAVLDTARVRAETIKAGQNMDEFLKDSSVCQPGTQKPQLSEGELSEKLVQVGDQLRNLELDCSAMQARIGQIGDQGDLQEQLAQAREKLNIKDMETRAIELAMAELEAANGEMRRRFAPALEKKTAEIFEYLTGGSFGIVEIRSAQMDVFVREEEAAQARDVISLSQGTMDELYLSMRLAMSDLLSRDAEIPLVLDDALVNFDDERMARAIDYLKELAKSRQVVVFTCQKREAEYVGNDDEINVVSL